MPITTDQPADRPDIPGVGDVAPDFRLPNASGEECHLADMVEHRPTIVLFYRGYW